MNTSDTPNYPMIYAEEPRIKLSVVYNPFDLTTLEQHELVYDQDKTLADYLEGLPGGATWLVGYNGEAVERERWAEIKPRPFSNMSLVRIPEGGKGGKSILRMVAMIALMVAAAFLTPYLTPIIGATWAAVATAAFVVVGSMAINALLPATSGIGSQTQDQQTYGIDGPKNTAKEGPPTPVVYGTHRIGGNIVNVHTRNAGDTQYLFMRTTLNQGEVVSVDNIEINQQPLTSFQDVTTRVTLGLDPSEPNDWFDENIRLQNRNAKITTSRLTHVTSTEVDRVRLDVVFPSGLANADNDKGDKNDQSVTFQIQYRETDSLGTPLGAGTWTDLPIIAPLPMPGGTDVIPPSNGFLDLVVFTNVQPNPPVGMVLWVDIANGYKPYKYSRLGGWTSDAVWDASDKVWVYTHYGDIENRLAVRTEAPTGVGVPGSEYVYINTTNNTAYFWDGGGLLSGHWVPVRTSNSPENTYGGSTGTGGTGGSGGPPIGGGGTIGGGTVNSDGGLTFPTDGTTDPGDDGTLIQPLFTSMTPTDVKAKKATLKVKLDGSADLDVDEGKVYARYRKKGDRHWINARSMTIKRQISTDLAGTGVTADFPESDFEINFPSPDEYEVQVTSDAATPLLLNPFGLGGIIETLPGYGTEASYSTGPESLTVTRKEVKAIRISYEGAPFPTRGFYEVSILRTTEEATSDKIVDTCYLTDIGEIDTDPIALNGIATLSIRVKLTDQLNGIPSLTALVTGSKMNIYNEAGEVIGWEYSENPADIVADILLNPIRGAGFASRRMLWSKYAEFREFCQANGHKFNGVFDTVRSVWDAMQSVAKLGHAAVMPRGTKFSFAIDGPAEPVMTFTPANIYKDTMRVTWMSLTDRANDFQQQYYDATDGYKQKVVRVSNNVALANGERLKTTTLDGFGITSVAQATEEAEYAIRNNRFIVKHLSLDAPIEAIGLNIGDVALIQHQAVKFADGYGGRLKAGSTTTVLNLDAPVQMEVGKDYSVLVIHDAIQRYTPTITEITGDQITVSGLPSTLDRVQRLKQGEVDCEVMSIRSVGGAIYRIVLDDAAGLTTGSAELWDTDVIEERDLAGVDELFEGDVLTVTSAFSQAPGQFTNFMFGEKSTLRQPFRLHSISGSELYRRTLNFVQYDERVYGEETWGTVVPSPPPVSRFGQVTNLHAVNDLVVGVEQERVPVTLTWRHDLAQKYGGADIYVMLPTDITWRNVGTVQNTDQWSGDFSREDVIMFKVVGFDDRGKRSAFASAPTYKHEVQIYDPKLDAPTNLTCSVPRFRADASLKVAWDAGPKRSTYEVSIKSVSSTDYAAAVATPLSLPSSFTTDTGYDDVTTVSRPLAFLSSVDPGYYAVRVRLVKGFRVSNWSYLPVQLQAGAGAGTGVMALPNSLTGLKINGGAGGASTGTFTGTSPNFSWDDVVAMANAQSVTDPDGAEFRLKNYQVQIKSLANAVLRTEYVRTPNYEYTFDKNQEDGAGRSFKIAVCVNGRHGQVGTPAVMTVSNDAPALSGLTITAKPYSIRMKFPRPSDADYRGIIVWMSTTNNFGVSGGTFTPNTSFEVWRDGGNPTLEVNPNTTYYIRYAFYDAFGIDSLNISTQQSITTPLVGSTTLDVTLGALATKDSVDLATSDVTNKKAANITFAAGATIESLKPGEAGANVTETRVASAITGQGGLATKSNVTLGTDVKDSGGTVRGDADLLNNKAQSERGFNRNPTFQNWTSTLPANYSSIGSPTVTKQTTSPRYGDWSLEVNSAGVASEYVYTSSANELRIPPELSYFVIEYEVTLVAGDFKRAGVLFRPTYNSGTVDYKQFVLNLYDEHPSPTVGSTYSGAKVLPLVATTGTPVGDPTGSILYLANNTASLSGGAYSSKTLRWHRVTIRRATRQEIRAELAIDDSGLVDLANNVKNKSLANLDATANTKLGGIASGATKNTVTKSTTAPASPTDGDIWIDTSSTPRVIKTYLSGVWEVGGRNTTATTDLSDAGALSRKSSVDLATTDVTNKTAGNITYTGGASVDSLKPGEAGANVTETRVASAISGQGALATKSAVDLATSDVSNKSLANLDSTANTKLGGIAAGADVTGSNLAKGSKVDTSASTTNSAPSVYRALGVGVIYELKTRTTLGVSGTATNGTLITKVADATVNGAVIVQHYDTNDGTFKRKSTVADDTTWGTWKKVYDEDQKPASTDVSGLGSLATKNAVDLATADVTNKSLANLDATANTKLGGIAAGADVTGSNYAKGSKVDTSAPSTASAPSVYRALGVGVLYELKNRSTLGVSGTATNGTLTTKVFDATTNGAVIVQHYDTNDGTFKRKSTVGDDTTWGSWKKVYDEDQKPAASTDVTGLGTLATKSSVDLATTDVTNKTAGNITYTGGASVDSLKPGEAGANVTETRVAASITGQGGLATKSNVTLGTDVKDSGGTVRGDVDLLNNKVKSIIGYNKQPTFQDWSSTLPNGWATLGSITVTKQTTSPHYGDWSLEIAHPASATEWLSNSSGNEIRTPPELTYFVIEYEVTLVSGDFKRAGVVWRPRYNSGTVDYKQFQVSLFDEHASPTVGSTYSGAKVVGVSSTVGTPAGDPTDAVLILAGNYNGLSGGASSVKTLRWHKALVRRATRQEIRAELAIDDSGLVDLVNNVKNKSLANVDATANTKLSGIAAGADVTGTNFSKGSKVDTGAASTDNAPSVYRALGATTYAEQKNRSTISAPGSATDGVLTTHVPSTSTSVKIRQRFDSDDGSYKRSSTNETTWGAWKKVYDEDNKPASTDVSGLGSLATKSAVDLATSDVSNKSLANLDSTANTKLSGIAAGADVTGSNYAKGSKVDTSAPTTNSAPSVYRALGVTVTHELKTRSNISAPGTATNGTLTTKVYDATTNGAVIVQLFESTDGSYKRKSTTGDDTTWQAWKKVYDEDNKPSASADVTGLGTLATKSTVAAADMSANAATPMVVAPTVQDGVVDDPFLTDTSYWSSISTGISFVSGISTDPNYDATVATFGFPAALKFGSTGVSGLPSQYQFAANRQAIPSIVVNQDHCYRASVDWYADSTFNGIISLKVKWYAYDGSTLRTDTVGTPINYSSGGFGSATSGVFSAVLVPPVGAVFVSQRLEVDWTATWASRSNQGNMWFSNLSMTRTVYDIDVSPTYTAAPALVAFGLPITNSSAMFLDVSDITTMTHIAALPKGTIRHIRFTNSLTLTHDSALLALPGGANITTQSGDVGSFVATNSTGNWKCFHYSHAGAIPITRGGTGSTTAAGALVNLGLTKGADIASASTTDLSTATGDFVNVTGTTTITALGTSAAGVERTVCFTGALTLTHNATSLILPSSANITTAANDTAVFRSLGSGNWLCISYKKANGKAVVNPATTDITGSGATGRSILAAATTAAARTTITPLYGLVEAETETFLNAITTRPTGNAWKRAMLYDALISTLKVAGIWTKGVALHLMAAADAQTAGLNLFNPTGAALTPTSSPTFTAYQGYAGDGTAAYLDTGITASTSIAARDNLAFGVISRTNRTASNSKFMFGTTANNNVRLNPRDASNFVVSRNNDAGSGATFPTTSTTIGFFADSRIVSTDHDQYFGAGASSSPTKTNIVVASTQAMPNSKFSYLSGSVANFDDAQLSAGFVFQGLTQTEMNTLYTALKTFLSDPLINAWL